MNIEPQGIAIERVSLDRPTISKTQLWYILECIYICMYVCKYALYICIYVYTDKMFKQIEA